MKKLIVLTAAAFTISLGVSAQVERNVPQDRMEARGGRGGHGKGQLMKELNLSADQKAKLKEQAKQMKAEREELKKMDNITVKEMRERQAKMRQSQQERINSVLNADQRAKLAELRKNRGGKMKKFKEKRSRTTVS